MNAKAMSIKGLHWGTAHVRHQITPHTMDFEHYPLPFKPYGKAKTLPLEPVREDPGHYLSHGSLVPFLSSLLYLAYGVTSVRQAGGIPFLSRTVPSAGGLYPCHLYLGVLPGNRSETGLYYYDPAGHGLTCLRQAGQGSALTGVKTADTSLVFVITACLYTSAWKYRDRSLRYVLLDAGHLVQNLVLAGKDQDMAVSYDFDDREIGELLGLDLSWEVPLALVFMNRDRSVSELTQAILQHTRACFPDVNTRPGEADYMRHHTLPARAYAAGGRILSGNGDAKGAAVWSRPPLKALETPWPDPGTDDLPGAGPAAVAWEDLPRVISRRRSRRNFTRQAVAIEAQQVMMRWAMGEDSRTRPDLSRISLAMACQGWEGLDDGLYSLDPETGAVALRSEGGMNRPLSRVCLGQDWVGAAGTVFLFMANLKELEEHFGIRGYRYAMMTAGRAGHRIYLGAETLGFGCCGIGAIYDEEAGDLLGLNRDSALLYAVAAGPVKKI